MYDWDIMGHVIYRQAYNIWALHETIWGLLLLEQEGMGDFLELTMAASSLM